MEMRLAHWLLSCVLYTSVFSSSYYLVLVLRHRMHPRAGHQSRLMLPVTVVVVSVMPLHRYAAFFTPLLGGIDRLEAVSRVTVLVCICAGN